jgi:Zn-dependent M28 family amino/carboxypeptidase
LIRRIAIIFGSVFVVLTLACGGFIAYATSMPGKSYLGALPPLSPAEINIRDELALHVKTIASEEHHAKEYVRLESAASYIEKNLSSLGYKISAQKFPGPAGELRNIETEIAGAGKPKEIILVGAHYDSVAGAQGANDNGSGTAAVLALAKLLKDFKPEKTIRFVWFVNEEPPYFKTEQMGSRIYAHRVVDRNENIAAMLSIETMGYYSDKPNTQHYPFPFSLIYPKTGNFIGFIGNLASRNLLHTSLNAFRDSTQFPSEGVAAPGWIPGVDWSDHWAFWEANYPALMITDTAPFRYPFYHTDQDTPDKIDYAKTARVVSGLHQVIKKLSQ